MNRGYRRVLSALCLSLLATATAAEDLRVGGFVVDKELLLPGTPEEVFSTP